MLTAFLLLAALGPQSQPNALTQWERSQGFELLFDGSTLRGWVGWRRRDVPANWRVEDSSIACVPQGGPGDIRYMDAFADFDLRFDWKIQPGGNSGVFFRASEDHQVPWYTAPEYQVLDDWKDGGKVSQYTAGANYDMHAPIAQVSRPPGEWNRSRIVAKGAHVEHWLNGVKIVDYDLGSPDWLDRFQRSKYRNMTDYGKRNSGFIVLQDHGSRVWYRSIRIRKL